MKREKSYNYFLAMVSFIVCYLVAFILATKDIKIGSLVATAGVTIYPITYFISTLFCDRYGKKHSLIMITYAVFALLLAAVLLWITTALPIYTKGNFLNLNINMMIGFMAAFVIGQILNLYIYYYLGEKSGFSFLISSVISITVDSLIFVLISFTGVYSLSKMVKLFTGQYVISVIFMVFLSLCFAYLTPAMKRRKIKHDDDNLFINKEDPTITEPKEETPKKKTTTKKAPAKTTTKKTTKTTSKTATKKPTTKKSTTKNNS